MTTMRIWSTAIFWIGLFIISVKGQTPSPGDFQNGTTDPSVSDPSLKTTSPVDKKCVDLKCIDKDLKGNNSSLLQFFAVTVLSGAWIIYITFFNSRLIGLILTKTLSAFVKGCHLKIGSFSFSVLSGKIMFRDVQYIDADKSVFIYDGYCIFRWWRPYKFSPWRKKRDLSEGHTRLSVMISGLEYHLYNRSDVYANLEKVFGLDSQIFSNKSKNAKTSPKKAEGRDSQTQKISWWRNLFPVIKISIPYGKVIIGNKLVPSTLVVAFEDASGQYNTTKASNKFDLFMHVLEGNLGSVTFMLVPSTKYDPAVLPEKRKALGNDPVPRTMGEGYDLINSNNVSFKYLWDEPGKTGMPLAQSKFSEYHAKTSDADWDDDSTLWELEVRCHRRVMLNYGPWADRQINLLWRFYYPLDYQKQEVTAVKKHGEIRAPTCFNMYVNLLHESDIDLLFLKNDEPSAMHIHLQKGSAARMHVPMTVAENGFTTTVSGELMYPDVSTSMTYRPLINAEILSFHVTANYPLIFNAEQAWNCDIKASKVSASLVFQHKNFIADLMDDWSNREAPDLLTFTPYKMNFNFDLQDFELLLPANEYNWVDCATKRKENAMVALTGRSLKIDFTLPFNSFLAPTYTIPFSFHILNGELCLYLPQSNPTKGLLLNLSTGMDAWNTGKRTDALPCGENGKSPASAKSCSESQEGIDSSKQVYENTHKLCKDPTWGLINSDWVKCWDAPEMELVISYTWHPIVPTREETPPKQSRNSDLNKEIEKVDKLLQRIGRSSKKSIKKATTTSDSVTDITDASPLLQDTSDPTTSQTKSRPSASVMFDPTSLDPDEICVNFTLKPGSTLYLYGSLLHHFIAVKENYLGVDDHCTDFIDGQKRSEQEVSEPSSNPLYYRTLQVTVNVNLHNVCGVLPVHSNPAFKSCPNVRLKRLTFEMDKNYHQTRLQLLLSKLAIGVEENILNPVDVFEKGDSGRKGWLMLTDLQLRGHAMFSGAGLPVGSLTIEYGWLTEVLVGPIVGYLSVPQIQLLAQWAQTFVFLLKNSLHELKPAYPDKYLPTGMDWTDKKTDGKPIAEGDVKFLMLQVKLESVKLRIEEKDSSLDLAVSPVLISNGNIQSPGVKEAASIRVHEVWIKHRIKKISDLANFGVAPLPDEVTWVEAGEVRFGSIGSMITVATPEREMSGRQMKFLRFHDKKTRRLHFLWQDMVLDDPDSPKVSVLTSVQSLKSWGCNFFMPLTSKHPTYFYKKRATPPRAHMSLHDGPRSFMVDTSTEYSTSSKEDDSDRDSDVFDPGMDYGMSLLQGGRCLLSRSRSFSHLSKKSGDCDSVDDPKEDLVEEIKPAGEVLGSIELHSSKEVERPSERRPSRPGLKRQAKITNSTGNINVPSMASLKDNSMSPPVRKASALRKPRSTTVPSLLTQPIQQQVSFAPSPEKINALKKSSSQADMNTAGMESPRPSMKRAMSSDSNLYRSAESDFKSTTSISSSVGDEFYSAESDVNESKNSTAEANKSRNSTAEAITLSPVSEVIQATEDNKETIARPGTLVLDGDPLNSTSTFSPSASSDARPTSIRSPGKSSSLSPGSGNSGESFPLGPKRTKSLSPVAFAPRQNGSILSCYESYLTVLRLNPPDQRSKKYLEVADEEDDDWFDESLYVLSNFSIIRDGIHPSVMVDRDTVDQDNPHHKHRQHASESANRELSFEEIDSSGKATSVCVHLKDSLDVQLTPFLLNTVSHVVDAAVSVVKHENPLSIVSQLEMGCLSDAADHLPEDEEELEKKPDKKEEKSKGGGISEKLRPSLKRQKRTDSSFDAEDKTKIPTTHTVTRPPPGIKLSFKVDKVRINVLQATLGDDKVFSLRSNKLLPTPCVTILATRLDGLHVSVDMNSRRKKQLLMENLRKISLSSSATSDRKLLPENAHSQMTSTSSDLVAHKHFLVLLNAKATARSVGFQMRALTCDGSAPDMTSVTALAEKDCKVPFVFNPDAASPTCKETVSKWNRTGHQTPELPSASRRKISRHLPSGPPKLWGWVIFEAGISRVRLNFIKQVTVKGTRDFNSLTSNENTLLDIGSSQSHGADGTGAINSPFKQSPHVHFMEDTPTLDQDGQNGEWTVQDSSLHASQAELFVGSVWINLPSPSASNLTRALRSWNLLSCVSASIACWLGPGDRMATSLTNLSQETLIRQCAVTACVLTEAFEKISSDATDRAELVKMKYDVLTTKAMLLRKDPSFLLCHEMQHFLSTAEGRQIVFAAVGPVDSSQKLIPGLPALSSLKKGVSALTKQWMSQYYGTINSAKSKKGKGPKKIPAPLFGFEVSDGKEAGSGTLQRPSLVVEVESPKFSTAEQESTSVVKADAAPRRQPKPISKQDVALSLSVIEEAVPSGSPEGTKHTDVGSFSLPPPKTQARPSLHSQRTEDQLLFEQQQSFYSWMSNQAKTESPNKGIPTELSPALDVESQNHLPNEVFGIEETDLSRPPQTLSDEQPQRISHIQDNSLKSTNFQEIFRIFLRNVGLDVSEPASAKIRSNVSFIKGECLGSLAVNVKLNLLRVDKHEADPLYNLDGQGRKKRKSSKIRRPRAYYSSLEHARELREPYVLNTATWPHMFPANASPVKSPPILICQEVVVKSSIVETDCKNENNGVGETGTIEEPVSRFLMKNRTTLKVGAELFIDDIVQHVDIALIRLIHQITEILDSVQQAKTDIQVNKYTAGSVSPDIKVLHQRKISSLSNDSANVNKYTAGSASPDIKVLHQRKISNISNDSASVHGLPQPKRKISTGQSESATEDEGNREVDAMSDSSASTASTEGPHCWQVMYSMVNFYDLSPESRIEVASKPADTLHIEHEGLSLRSERSGTFSLPPLDPYLSMVLKATARVKKIELHAAIGDIKLNAEIMDILTKADHCKEVLSAYKNKASSKFNTTLHSVKIHLADQAGRQQSKTIASASIKKSSLDAGTDHQRDSSENFAELHLGVISFDLSQHPASLHDVVSRGSRQLSAHITEFAQTPTVKQSYTFDHPDAATPRDPSTPVLSSTTLPPMTPMTPSVLMTLIDLSQDSSSAVTSVPVNARVSLTSDGVAIVATLLPSLHAEYKTGVLSCEGQLGLDATFTCSLPDHVLQFSTKYSGYGDETNTVIHLPEINVSGEYRQGGEEQGTKQFRERWKSSNFSPNLEGDSSELRLRSGDYLSVAVEIGSFEDSLTTDLLNQLIFLQEVFLTEVNEMIDKVSKTTKPVSIWSEHSIKSEDSSTTTKPLLYQLQLTLKGIQITAVTPSCNAVRLKTGEMTFELSNLVVQEKGSKKKKKKTKGIDVPKYLKLFGKAQVDLTLSLGTLVRNSVYPEAEDEFLQLAYFTTRIGLQNTTQGSDEPPQARGCSSASAFTGNNNSSATTTESSLFNNTSAHSIDDRLLHPQTSTMGEDGENSVVLISLTRPLFFIQPTAFDKAILVYLSYKNAYEDWKEEQKTVMKTARQVRDAFQSSRSKPTSSTSLPRSTQQQRTSTVFLQLSVNDLGICLPMADTVQLHGMTKRDELPSALVLTIDNTLISAYYSRSLFTKGQMKGFCLRFTDDFQTSWDDWKHNPNANGMDVSATLPKVVMNSCIVPEGTYEIRYATTTHQSHSGGPPTAKTKVNLTWRMKGMDVHFDTKIGSYFSRLTDTLMAITGDDEHPFTEELDIPMSQSEDDNLLKPTVDSIDGPLPRRSRSSTVASTASSQAVPFEVHRERAKKIEHELNEQVKIVQDLRQLGAKKSLLDEQEQRMHELENALSSNFRRVFKSRLRRSSLKAGSRKDSSVKKFKPTHHRAKSAATSGSTMDGTLPISSKSSYSTFPSHKGSTLEWPDPPARDSQSSSAVGYRSSATSDYPTTGHPSPLAYDLDHVFPPSPNRSYGQLYGDSEDSEEDISSCEEDIPDGAEASLNQPARRELYASSNIQTSTSESNLVNMSQATNSPPEAELQLQLEVHAEVDGGKIECHPILEEVDTSIRPDYGVIPPAYTASKPRNYVRNTTVFYIPGLDVKVHYNSASSGSAPNSSQPKDGAFSFSPHGMETVMEQNESPESPEFTTPPPALQPHNVNDTNSAVDVPVPDIEITTPSRFSEKERKMFSMPELGTDLPPSPAQRKRACVQAWVRLQSLPEMVITPYLLDFVEQTLNEIATLNAPMQSFSQKHSTASSRHDSFHDSFAYSDEEPSDLDQCEINNTQMQEGSVLSSESPLVSLPLDVIVSVNMQPSQVRFNCVPISRVECLLQIPNIDLEFSSFQDDDEEDCDLSDSSDKKTDSEKSGQTDGVVAGNTSKKGLRFMAVLSDFSVYVFHPYGGKQPAGGGFPLDMSSSFVSSPAPGTSDSPFVKSGSGRRDSLNVNLEFVKISLIRKTKGDTVIVADVLSPGGSRGRLDSIVVHVNGVLDIGKASFKYDMRRLNEILAFPRAWYRRSIARRLFLGDTNEQPSTSRSSPYLSRRDKKQPRTDNVKSPIPQSRPYAHTAPVDSSILSFLTVDSPLSPQQRPLTRTSNTSRRQEEAEDDVDSSPGGSTGPTKWKALIDLKMTMSRLDVEMNMSNVMGNTTWSCNALSSTGKLMFHSNGDREITLTCGLDNSQIFARGGIIGGHIELQKFDADCQLNDPAQGSPSHNLHMRADSLDGRIEYMGGCVMMGQLTQVKFHLQDEWTNPVQSIPSCIDKETVYVHSNIGWRVFQLAISRSTTPDVIKMLTKLEEFFSQQLHSSVRAISSLTQSHTRPQSPERPKEPIVKQSSTDPVTHYDHRRHWPPVYKAIAAAKAEPEQSGAQNQNPNCSLLLGGTACLHGEALIVVCFHGANFRSRSWVLFNILQPNIMHSSEVQEIKETVSGDETSTLAIQSLTVNLGHDQWLSRTRKSADPMATVSRVTRSRNQNPPPGSAAISEWFAYMTASHNEELKMLRTLNDLGRGNAGNASASSKTSSPQVGQHTDSTSNMAAYSHEADIIFALPKVQLEFKTEHIQGPTEPDPNDTTNKPSVECTFVTEFTDHICVTMDVELLLFLHDLISSYLKEKQQALSTRTKLSSLTVGIWNESFDGSHSSGSPVPKPLPVDPIDLREFLCKTWQLEPTVTLISWAGRRIEPVGVDYILQKLGFQHARTTIPKWIQRGVLDLLDKGLAVTVEKLVVAIIREQRNK